MGEFVHMGGYAAFVWPSYAITFGVIALLLWRAVARAREAERAAEAFDAEQATLGRRVGGRTKAGAAAETPAVFPAAGQEGVSS